MVSFDYTIKDAMGLHARPVGLMVKAVNQYKQTAITVECNGRSADAKRMFAVMGLGVQTGETITIKVVGDNEQEVADAIKGIFLSENL